MTPLESMWLSFIGLGLMFVSAVTALLGKEKLSGFLRFIVLSFSFICIIIAGLIVLVVVVPGSRADL
ncbi:MULTISPECIES: DUF2768 domain-containing protein [Geomicrobium]|uniref:DUF2768 domain-containing protein n=2 Tax=Geomicrobium TaxID=767528 RepID=A0ABS2PEI7_9BACL|nr:MULTISPECIES: DUF2768 domain-containing protein [Geomicrobium]EZH67624.1 hypothetical protein DH09_06740 [Bacillaceae bacterium JMAK1]MBM7633541.1 hypothetical protein [Geomicrobium sediminis]GAJ98732.1 hypothetical protein JCM19055_1682 [Geomicrobium sp. JCM 19055]